MAKIEGFRVRNYRALKDLKIGCLWNDRKSDALTPVTAVIGKNGVGKSTLFDAFGFIADSLKFGVEEACDISGRGGFEKIRSKGTEEPIQFEIYYRQHSQSRPLTYEFSVGLDVSGRPYVLNERLRQRRAGQKTGRPFSFLILQNGKGIVWKNEFIGIDETKEDFESLFLKTVKTEHERAETEPVEMVDARKLGIATLGVLKQHPRISMFREFIQEWYLSYFTPDAARSLPLAGPQKRLNVHGDNLANVVQYMERENPDQFKKILSKIAKKIPGINSIKPVRTPDGRVLLEFNDRGFQDPFYAQQMSDGTLKVFAYLLLLEDPSPPSFLCFEEPENGLYHKLLDTLATEFRYHAESKGSSQIFVTTHQPYFVNALKPEEVWVLQKGEDGFSTIRRASEDPIVKNLVDEGLPLGNLWYSDYLDA